MAPNPWRSIHCSDDLPPQDMTHYDGRGLYKAAQYLDMSEASVPRPVKPLSTLFYPKTYSSSFP